MRKVLQMRRPHTNLGVVVATPSDIELFTLLGGHRFQGVGFTQEQVQNLWQCYEFEGDCPELAPHLDFESEGSLRNLFRHVDSDGLRIMAFLAKFCEPGEDPVQLIARALAEQGYDVSLDMFEWDETLEEE